MHEDFFDKGMQIKRDLRLLGATLHNLTLAAAADYIDKLEVLLVTAEGSITSLETRGLSKPTVEILRDFTTPKSKKIKTRVIRTLKNLKIEKKDLPAELQHLGVKVLDAFIVLVRESHEWGGEPCVGSSSAGSSLRGSLPHLKRADLLTTYLKPDGSERGTGTYVRFTEFGKRMAKEIDELIDLTDIAPNIG